MKEFKEYIIRIPEGEETFVTTVIEKFGYELEEVPKKNVKKSATTKKKEKVSPTYLFGKWKNLDIDAKQIRNQAWDRNQKF